jgi:hypothetical protein
MLTKWPIVEGPWILVEHKKIAGQAYHGLGIHCPPPPCGWEWRDFIGLWSMFFLADEVTTGKENGCSKYRPWGG